MLLQHRGDGDGSGEVEREELHAEGGGLDGCAEAEEDLSAGLSAALLACSSRRDSAGGSQVEPAWVGRG